MSYNVYRVETVKDLSLYLRLVMVLKIMIHVLPMAM